MRTITLVALSALVSCKPSGDDPLEFGKRTNASPTAGVAASAISLDARRAHVPPSSNAALGMNLSSVYDYIGEQPFANVFKQSRAWISTSEAAWDDGRAIDVDERGWVKSLLPGQSARSLVIWGPYELGTYKVTWKGTGKVSFWPHQAEAESKGEGSYSLVVTDAGQEGIAVTITETDPADPIRDIALYLPGLDETQFWNPKFLTFIKPFSVLRMMDWMETNNCQMTTTRTHKDDARYSGKSGVPPEVIARLANDTKKDVWINIGHKWEDALIDEWATALRDTISPERRIYIEHSNEVWNGIFEQAEHMSKIGEAKKLGEPNNPFLGTLRAHAERTAHIHKRFDAVFGARSNQLVRVLGSWAEVAYSSAQALDHLKAKGLEVDAVAIAPYFGDHLGSVAARPETRTMELKDLVLTLDKYVDDAVGKAKEHAQVARTHNVALVAYEGGQHLVGQGEMKEDEHLNRLFDKVQYDPGMKRAYLRYLEGWKHVGGSLFVAFAGVSPASKHGRWGAIENYGQTREQAPKYDALLTFIEKTPSWF